MRKFFNDYGILMLVIILIAAFVALLIFLPGPPSLMEDAGVRSKVEAALMEKLNQELGEGYLLEVKSIYHTDGGLFDDPSYQGVVQVTMGNSTLETHYEVYLSYTSIGDFSPVEKE